MMPYYTPTASSIPVLHHLLAIVGLLTAGLAIALPIYLFIDGATKRASAKGETFGTALLSIMTKARSQSGGYLTHLGMGFLIAGLFSTGAGVAGVIGANDANTRLQAYSGASIAAEQPSVEALQARLGANTVLAAVGLVLGPIAAALGIGFIAGDAPRASVAFVPLSQGGVFVLSAGF